MEDGSELQTVLVTIFAPLICGTTLWLWHLARNSFQGRVLLVALWLVLSAMSIISGPPFVIIMGAAAMMTGMCFYAIHRLPWR